MGIVERLRKHVSSRLANPKYRLKGENAAWVMMEEAADRIEQLEIALKESQAREGFPYRIVKKDK